MTLDQVVPFWEKPVLREVAGETLRPGGFELTDRAAQIAGVAPGWRVLDVGSGLGATVNRLRSRYGVEAFGVESSASQIEKSGIRSHLIQASGDNLPLVDGAFHMVSCECVLSLFSSPKAALKEFHRVLKPGGYLALSDLFVERGSSLHSGSCADRAVPLSVTQSFVEKSGFTIARIEDHTHLLKNLAARLLFVSGDTGDSCACDDRRGLGYYLMIAVRG